jgi:hypothetical protein
MSRRRKSKKERKPAGMKMGKRHGFRHAESKNASEIDEVEKVLAHLANKEPYHHDLLQAKRRRDRLI